MGVVDFRPGFVANFDSVEPQAAVCQQGREHGLVIIPGAAARDPRGQRRADDPVERIGAQPGDVYRLGVTRTIRKTGQCLAHDQARNRAVFDLCQRSVESGTERLDQCRVDIARLHNAADQRRIEQQIALD